MSNCTVLVTGAGGYVGRHVVTALLDRGANVIATVRPGSRAEVDPRATVVAVDILDPDLDLSAVADAAPSLAVHLAWQDGFTHNAPSHMLHLSDHYRLLNRLAKWGVERLSVLGTMHEIGYWEGAVDASTPTAPSSLYGIAKDSLRRATLVDLADKVELQWIRCYYIYGDDRNNRSIFTRLLNAADAGETSFPFTTGKNVYDFIEVTELGRQIAVVSTTPGLTGIINCGSGEPTSLADKAQKFIDDNDLGLELQFGAFPDRPYDSPGTWADTSVVSALMARA